MTEKKRGQDFVLALLAGVCIALAGFFSASVGGGLTGSVCFCMGLILVVGLGLNLYTGKIGPVTVGAGNWREKIPFLLIVLLGNVAGVFTSAWGLQWTPKYEAVKKAITTICEGKLALTEEVVFTSAVACGALMWLAVTVAKYDNQVIATLGLCLCVICFIETGSNHSIANCFYFAVCGWSLKAFWYFLIAVLGNTVGAVLPALAYKYAKK